MPVKVCKVEPYRFFAESILLGLVCRNRVSRTGGYAKPKVNLVIDFIVNSNPRAKPISFYAVAVALALIAKECVEINDLAKNLTLNPFFHPA